MPRCAPQPPHTCLNLMAAASPAGPAPTMTTSNCNRSRSSGRDALMAVAAAVLAWRHGAGCQGLRRVIHDRADPTPNNVHREAAAPGFRTTKPRFCKAAISQCFGIEIVGAASGQQTCGWWSLSLTRGRTSDDQSLIFAVHDSGRLKECWHEHVKHGKLNEAIDIHNQAGPLAAHSL
jgi:hypothetical protein